MTRDYVRLGVVEELEREPNLLARIRLRSGCLCLWRVEVMGNPVLTHSQTTGVEGNVALAQAPSPPKARFSLREVGARWGWGSGESLVLGSPLRLCMSLVAVEEAVVGEEVWRGVEAGAEEGAAWSRGAEVPFSRAEEAGEDGGGGLGRGCGDTVALCSGCSSGYARARC